jgi:hypothetical protein
MADKEKEVEAAISDKTKQSRLVKFFTTLAGQDFKSIIDAIHGTPQDFTEQLEKVDAQRAEIEKLKAQVAKRGLRLGQIDAELDRLKQEESGTVGNIGDVKKGIVKPPDKGFL